MTLPTIKLGKIILRPKILQDAESDYYWRCDKELAMLDASRPLRQSFGSFLRQYRNDLENPIFASQKFAIETLDGKHIGSCMCYDIDTIESEAEVGIMIGDRDYWSQGYGYNTMIALLDYVFYTFKLQNVYLHTLTWNHRAKKCFEKCGFTPIHRIRRDGWELLRMNLSRESWFKIREKKLLFVSDDKLSA